MAAVERAGIPEPADIDDAVELMHSYGYLDDAAGAAERRL